MENIELFKTNLPEMTNERLCDVVVSFQYLGVMRDEALLSMTELARRRNLGEVFDYEGYIAKALTTLPKFKLDVKQILKVVKL